jgi:hypothetical protein
MLDIAATASIVSGGRDTHLSDFSTCKECRDRVASLVMGYRHHPFGALFSHSSHHPKRVNTPDSLAAASSNSPSFGTRQF